MKLPTAEDVIDGERDILSIARQIRRIEDGEFTKFETLQEYAKTLGLNMLITLVEE